MGAQSRSKAISTAVDFVKAPLVYKGKVRELYDLGEHFLIVVTDRISAFDYVLDPAVPDKGNVRLPSRARTIRRRTSRRTMLYIPT